MPRRSMELKILSSRVVFPNTEGPSSPFSHVAVKAKSTDALGRRSLREHPTLLAGGRPRSSPWAGTRGLELIRAQGDRQPIWPLPPSRAGNRGASASCGPTTAGEGDQRGEHSPFLTERTGFRLRPLFFPLSVFHLPAHEVFEEQEVY